MFRKIACLALAVSASLLLVACNPEQQQPPKPGIIVIDQETVYRESDAAKAAVAHLDSLSRDLQARLMELQAATRTDEDKDQAQEAFEAGLNELQQQFAAEQEQVTTRVTALTEQAIETIRKETGASIAIGSEMVLSRDAAVDYTARVIAEMNKTRVTFARIDAGLPATNSTMKDVPATNATVPATNATVPATNATVPATNATAK